MDVPDLDALVAALQSPEAAEAMKSVGVHTDTVVLLVESQVRTLAVRLWPACAATTTSPRSRTRTPLLFYGAADEMPVTTATVETLHRETFRAIGGQLMEIKLRKKWRKRHPAPAVASARGFVVPQFLGGDISIENLSMFDRDVYWELCTQLIRHISDIPPGTPITGLQLRLGAAPRFVPVEVRLWDAPAPASRCACFGPDTRRE